MNDQQLPCIRLLCPRVSMWVSVIFCFSCVVCVLVGLLMLARLIAGNYSYIKLLYRFQVKHETVLVACSLQCRAPRSDNSVVNVCQLTGRAFVWNCCMHVATCTRVSSRPASWLFRLDRFLYVKYVNSLHIVDELFRHWLNVMHLIIIISSTHQHKPLGLEINN